MELQVLVATMNQQDLSLAQKMNLQQNAVIANQCGDWRYEETPAGAGTIRMLSTGTRGVGVNRNLALQLATADILLFADDDIVYYDSDLQPVIDAFKQLPDADVIFFSVDITKGGAIHEKRHDTIKRVHLWNSLRYGTYRIAVRRESIIKKRIGFSPLFGGGCMYGSGEDTLFILDCLKAGLHLYSHEYVLGACAKDSSTWFTGYTDKYFFDRGAMLACGFPMAKHLLKWYFGIKLGRKSGVSLGKIIRLMNAGIKAFRTLTPYQEPEKQS